MTLPRALAKHTLTIKSPGTKTVYGAEVDDWAAAKVTTRTIKWCVVESKGTDEDNNRRDTTSETFDVLIPAGGQPPSSRDKVRHPLAAGDFTVNGKAMPVVSSDGRLNHYFCNLKRWSAGG